MKWCPPTQLDRPRPPATCFCPTRRRCPFLRAPPRQGTRRRWPSTGVGVEADAKDMARQRREVRRHPRASLQWRSIRRRDRRFRAAPASTSAQDGTSARSRSMTFVPRAGKKRYWDARTCGRSRTLVLPAPGRAVAHMSSNAPRGQGNKVSANRPSARCEGPGVRPK
jgi:hypothetical protein